MAKTPISARLESILSPDCILYRENDKWILRSWSEKDIDAGEHYATGETLDECIKNHKDAQRALRSTKRRASTEDVAVGAAA